MQTENRRRSVFEAVLAKAERLETKFEDDPDFRASVDEWIAGTIEIDELRQRYRLLVETRRNIKAATRSSLTDPPPRPRDRR